MDKMTLAFIISLIAFFLILSAWIREYLANKPLRRQLQDAIQNGLELQRHAEANDHAWREGQDDLEAALGAEILDRDDKIRSLEVSLEGSRAWGLRIFNQLTALETEHAMHADHCLPVLESMRNEITEGDDGYWDSVKESPEYRIYTEGWKEEHPDGDAADS